MLVGIALQKDLTLMALIMFNQDGTGHAAQAVAVMTLHGVSTWELATLVIFIRTVTVMSGLFVMESIKQFRLVFYVSLKISEN